MKTSFVGIDEVLNSTDIVNKAGVVLVVNKAGIEEIWESETRSKFNLNWQKIKKINEDQYEIILEGWNYKKFENPFFYKGHFNDYDFGFYVDPKKLIFASELLDNHGLKIIKNGTEKSLLESMK